MKYKLLFTLMAVALLGINISDAQTVFSNQDEVAEYLEGEWNLDVVQGGFTPGPIYLPSPNYFDSTVHKIIFEITEIDSTPLLCRAFIADTLYQETYVEISQNLSQIILPRWLLFNLPDNLEHNVSLMEEIGFYGFSQDTITLSGSVATDGFEFGLTRLTSSTKETIQEEDISIYPNPSDGRIFIDGIQMNTPYQLFNMEGKLIKSGVINDNFLHLETSGINILTLNVEGKWISKKVVIEG